jgi:membrane protease YdiL (CAAX protease family)
MLLSFALALLFILIMGLVCGWVDAVKLKLEPRWTNIAKPLISGVMVSFLEEFLFRGAVLVILSHALGRRAGLWWMVGIFSILHFLKPPVEGALPDNAVNWGSGFWVITQLFSGFKTWNAFVGEFLLLATVGWVLGRVRLASGGLWVGIGLHAGWVAGMKYFSGVVDRRGAVDAGEFSPWMVKNTCRAIVSPIVGIVPLIAVLMTGLVALWVIHRWWPRQAPEAPAQKGA